MAPSNTSKIAINNEIVLMRQAVRQSRVAVVRKLIKEAKLLQARKHGNEKVQEKCKRKAQRLLAEIAAMKKLKDDEISKFGITNIGKLPEVLADMSAEPSTRIMTRVANHKTLSSRISEFKEKFPEYEEHLGPGRKKLSKIQRQTDRQARNALRKSALTIEANGATAAVQERLEDRIGDEKVDESSQENSSDESEQNDDSTNAIEPSGTAEIEDDVAERMDDSLAAEHCLEPGSILRIHAPGSPTKKRKVDEDPAEIGAVDSVPDLTEKPKKSKKSQKLHKPKRLVEVTSSQSKPSEESNTKFKNKEDKKIDPKAPMESKKPRLIKIVSKEATVKRFADLVDDEEPHEFIEPADSHANVKKKDTKIEKEVDSFFMTENGESEYLSVVVPRAKPCEDDENDDRFGQNHAAQRQKNFHDRNNKFFSKIDQRANFGDKFGAKADGRTRKNDFGNGGGSSERFGRNFNGPARVSRNGKPDFEKKIEPKDEELHPSWAARKKQQEILKQGFQGKKIVFGD